MLRYAYERCDGGPPAPCPGRNHPGPVSMASWIQWCRPRPISITDLRPINGGHEKNDDDLNEGVDSANRIATVNGYRHDCWLLFDLVRWLRARDLLVLPSSLRIWQGGPTL